MPSLVDRLETLQHHKSDEVYKQLSKILQRFFTLDSNPFWWLYNYSKVFYFSSQYKWIWTYIKKYINEFSSSWILC